MKITKNTQPKATTTEACSISKKGHGSGKEIQEKVKKMIKLHPELSILKYAGEWKEKYDFDVDLEKQGKLVPCRKM